MFKKDVFVFLINVSLLFANIFSYADEKIYSVKETVQINEAKKFNEIQIGQKKYLFKLYDPIINYFGKEFGKETVNDIETNQNHSPLLSDLAAYKIFIQTDRPISERFSEWLSKDRDSETKWNLMHKYYTDKGENITKDNFDKVILNYHKKRNIQIDYMGEVRKDNFAAIIARITEKSDDGNRHNPPIHPICFYKENDRWYRFNLKDYTEEGEAKKFFQVISDECWYNNISKKESVFHDIFLASEAITREREPWWFEEPEEKVIDVTKEIWHEWETHIGDINVIGKFISYEGKYVTVEKKDGERVKLEY
ncbi:MAG: hypothetical protein LBI18_03845, partial [Planctomycetaceae bacterium]|nr:hypothetical protein [Planctomycetaceae bacterium]